jgi:hypothetical protein
MGCNHIRYFGRGDRMANSYFISRHTLTHNLPTTTIVADPFNVINTFHPHGVYILRGLSSHQSGAL